jgi:hypothetical protein
MLAPGRNLASKFDAVTRRGVIRVGSSIATDRCSRDGIVCKERYNTLRNGRKGLTKVAANDGRELSSVVHRWSIYFTIELQQKGEDEGQKYSYNAT